MLKMKIDPGMCMKTKASVTKQPIIKRASWPKIHEFRKNGRPSIGLLGRKRTGCGIIGGERAPSKPAWVAAKGRHTPIQILALQSWRRFETMSQKQKGLSPDGENLAKIYVIEIKRVISLCGGQGREKKVPQNEGKSKDVIENKWRKNVGFGA